jgi:hypothetical protein
LSGGSAAGRATQGSHLGPYDHRPDSGLPRHWQPKRAPTRLPRTGGQFKDHGLLPVLWEAEHACERPVLESCGSALSCPINGRLGPFTNSGSLGQTSTVSAISARTRHGDPCHPSSPFCAEGHALLMTRPARSFRNYLKLCLRHRRENADHGKEWLGRSSAQPLLLDFLRRMHAQGGRSSACSVGGRMRGEEVLHGACLHDRRNAAKRQTAFGIICHLVMTGDEFLGV